MDAIELIQEFIDEIKVPQGIILDFIEDESIDEIDYSELNNYIKNEENQENKYKLYELIRLIAKISKNHFRTQNFFIKIEKILKNFENEIKKNFSNSELFNLFKSDKRLLLFCFANNIIIPDKSISDIITSEKFKSRFYPEYFYPEFKSFFDPTFCDEILRKNPEIKEDYESYKENRLIGENDAYVCKLIQHDLIEDFVVFVTRNNLLLNSKIGSSIYETNSTLLKSKNITLIEYAAFFGSIQIFQYLRFNKVDLLSNLWLFTIHGKNAELIHLLEENKVRPYDLSYEKYLFESIKCHHADIMDYLINEFRLQNNRINGHGIKYSNFICISNNDYLNTPNNVLTNIFYNLCEYEHYYIVDSIIKKTNYNINTKNTIISNFQYFSYHFINLIILIKFNIHLILLH